MSDKRTAAERYAAEYEKHIKSWGPKWGPLPETYRASLDKLVQAAIDADRELREKR